jgi:hypothetical protein
MSSRGILIKSRSYPENLKDARTREYIQEQKEQNEIIEKFREKDFQRTERFASLGSPSSTEVVVVIDWRASCCRTTSRITNYLLEREEDAQYEDEQIRKKSYAGFYYFIKWFIRALFFLIFSTLGTIAGKETGCAIKDNSACKSNVIDLIDGSPHMAATILGTIFGLFIGQWVGRLVWDYSTEYIRRFLRRLEKWEDKSKIFLFLVSSFVYVIVSGVFTIVFFFFVKIGNGPNVIGSIVGGCLGLILAGLAYRKSSNCRSGEQETPSVHPENPRLTPPELVV